MQIYDQSVEMICIKTLTSLKVPELVRSNLLGKLSKEFFHYPPCQAAFNRIDNIAKKRFALIDFDELVSDPAVSEEFRDILRESDAEHAHSKKKVKSIVELLDNYRKIRIVYDMCNDALEKVESEDVDVEKLLGALGDKLLSAQRNIGVEDEFVHFGKNSNSAKLIEEAVNKTINEMYKTGFTEYDDRNGGVPKEGVMIIGATTSGGKSTVLMNLLINIHRLNRVSTKRISLEMGDIQEIQRMGSRLSGVPFWKIKQGRMSPAEKQRFLKAFKDFEAFGVENDCTFSSISPTKGMTIDDAFRAVKPFGPKVIGLDYVSLLEGVDEDNQWRVLSAIIRKAKIFSREAKCLVIILCQIDGETNKIRYSQGMKEHADLVWTWNYAKKEQRELRILPIEVSKARDGELFSFNLGERYDVMRVDNMSDTDGGSEFNGRHKDDSDDGDDVPTKSSTKKKDKKKKKKRNLLEEESDDQQNDESPVLA